MKKEYRDAIFKVNFILHQLPKLVPYNNADFGLATSSLKRIVQPTQEVLFNILIFEKENIPLDENIYESLNKIIYELKVIIGEWLCKCDTHPTERKIADKNYFLELFEKSSFSQEFMKI